MARQLFFQGFRVQPIAECIDLDAATAVDQPLGWEHIATPEDLIVFAAERWPVMRTALRDQLEGQWATEDGGAPADDTSNVAPLVRGAKQATRKRTATRAPVKKRATRR